MKTANPILFFSLSVIGNHADGVSLRVITVNVIAKTLSEAKDVVEKHYIANNAPSGSIVKMNVIEVRQPNNSKDKPDIEDVINPEAFDDGVFFNEMVGLEENQNPFHHDSGNMGTSLVRDWTVMHPGYDSREQPFPLRYSYFHSRRTGARIGVRFGENLG